MNYPGGTIVYIRQGGPNIQFSTDNSTWSNVTFPVIVTNNNPSLGLLNIEFTTDITLTTNNDYFVCGSSDIQFGKSSLKNDGTRPIISVYFTNYDGFINNGSESAAGYNNIYIYNLIVVNGGIGSLQIGTGWIGQKGFANSSINNYIINCSSSGDLPGGAVGSGGIVGSYAGKYLSGNSSLVIIGCSSSGNIGQQDGGIVGQFAGYGGGTVTCIQCFSTGVIQNLSGGIFGNYAGYQGGIITATKCYSTGEIGSYSGGIFGRFAGYYGQASADQCYSRGNISNFGGGIFGDTAGISLNITQYTIASNCYSFGSVTTPGNGIYGSTKYNGTEVNCYVANGSWTDSDANLSLLGIPSPIIGSTWIKDGFNQPYILNNIGYTPYSINNISTSGIPSLVQSFSQTINAGGSTSAGIINGLFYQIFDISKGGSFGTFPTITINSTTGVISTTSGTASGQYTIYLRSDYNNTQFNLTVNSETNNNNAGFLLLLLLLQRRYYKEKYPWLAIQKI